MSLWMARRDIGMGEKERRIMFIAIEKKKTLLS